LSLVQDEREAMAQPHLDPRGLDAQVADIVRDRILTGTLIAGQHLVESALAAELNVSQGTIRAGLRLLHPEGLVETRPNRGVFVATLSPEDVVEVYSLRNALEGLAARLAAERMTETGRAKLTDALARLRAAVDGGDASAAIQCDWDIHELIVALSGHRRLSALHASFLGQTALFMNLAKPLHEDLEEIYTLHAPLIDAILAGDAVKAEDIARNHNTEDGERLRERMIETSRS
jgi:DNA-binding GntR family transcriptional regulator